MNREKTKWFKTSKLLAVLLLFICADMYAQQNGSIKGLITDDVTGEVLIGANVFIPELNIGASTDVNGEYFIGKVPAGTHALTIRYVGYKQYDAEVTVSADESVTLDAALEPTAVQMDELIVTGQGSATERRKLTTTVETLNMDDIQAAPMESVDKLLQGRITGLASFNSSGMPGTSGRISTRGVKSAYTSTTPVVYVDNVRVDNSNAFRLALDTGGAESSALADLVVGEIDRIEVIKGGAASTIYGSEAANGVIQIFTKKGVPGAPRWTFNVTSGFDQPEDRFIKEDFVKDYVLRSSNFQSYSASVSGGSELFTYNVYGKLLQNDGVLAADMLDNKNYNLAAGFRVHMQENMNLEVSSSYTKNVYHRAINNNLPYSPIGAFEIGTYDTSYGYTDQDRLEALETMQTNEIRDNINRFRFSSNLDYSPSENFTNLFTFGIDYRKNESRDFVPKKSGDYFFINNGYLYRADREYVSLTFAYNGTYVLPDIGMLGQKLNFGAQGFRVEDRESASQGEGFAIPGTEDFDNAALIDAQESNRELFSGGVFLVDQLSLWDRVFLDAGVRMDGNTTFGDEVGVQVYPKVGVAYNISDESFYPDFLKTYVPSLKLRASWGQTGNFPAPFTRDRTYGSQAFLDKTGISYLNPGNDDLKPEKTSSIDAGFDMGLLGGRAYLEFNYFNQTTTDALFQVPRDPATGFGTQLTNVGEIKNSGIEVSFNAKILQLKDFALSTRISYATLDNEVVSLGGAPSFDLAGFTIFPRRITEGYPVGVYVVNEPVKDATGTYSGDFVEKYVGSPLPTDFGNISLSMVLFKNITVSALAEFAFGHYFLDLRKPLRWLYGTADMADVVPPGYNLQSASSYWLEKADWVKMREILVSYRVPYEYLKGLTLSLSVRNPFVIATDAENDPELHGAQDAGGPEVGGYGYTDISASKQFRLGLTYQF